VAGPVDAGRRGGRCAAGLRLGHDRAGRGDAIDEHAGGDERGQAILVSNQFSDRLGAVVAERAAGYALTFRDPTPGDFRFHEIEIAIERPGVRATYRRGYRVRSDEEKTLDAIIANLNLRGAENPLQAKASTGR